MKKQISKKIRYGQATAVVIILSAFVISLLVFLFSEPQKTEVIDFSSGWNVEFRGQKHENVEVDTEKFSGIKKGESVVISRTISEDLPERQYVSFIIYLAEVEATIDGENIYEYGSALNKAGKLVGSGYHFIALPYGSAGKELRITATATGDGCFTGIQGLEYSSYEDFLFDYFYKNALTIVVCLFLVTLGIIVSVITAFTLYAHSTFFKFLPVGLFSILIGIYGLSTIKFFEMIGVSLYVNTVTEYWTLYLVPVPITLIFMTLHKNDKVSKIMIRVTFAAVTAFAVLSAIGNSTSIALFPDVLTEFHILAVFVLVVGFVVIFKNVNYIVKENSYLTIGFILLCLSAVLDIARFNIQKYILPNSAENSISFLPLGALFFIVFLLINYTIAVYKSEREQTEKDILAKLAYTDALTGLCNRAKWIEDSEKINNSKEEFCVISLDLNGLKKVNDSRGHEWGDILIVEFSNVLKETFKDTDMIYRMGGDEFIVILQETNMTVVKGLLKDFIEIEKKHSAHADIDISAAFGVAFSSEEANRSVQKIGVLADQRMYKVKAKYHMGR